MDIFALLKEKRDQVAAWRQSEGIDAVIQHLEVADSHFQRARDTGDNNLFTDVVYRTNHAFEGLLKEAYQILAGNEAERRTPFEIEKYLEEEYVLRPRVLEQFTHYRRNWRNPSTHDYQLYFDEQEAMLALASVGAFCFVALSQMLQALAAERISTTESISQSIKEILKHDKLTDEEFVRRLAEQLAILVPYVIADFKHSSHVRLSEATLVGALQGALQTSVESLDVEVEPRLDSGGTLYRPDLLLNRKDGLIVIELKTTGKRLVNVGRRKRELLEQLGTYVSAASAAAGIGIVYTSGTSAEDSTEYRVESRSFQGRPVWIISPTEG